MFAHGLYGKTNHDVVSYFEISFENKFDEKNILQHMQCNATAHIPDRAAFPDNDEPAESDIYKVKEIPGSIPHSKS